MAVFRVRTASTIPAMRGSPGFQEDGTIRKKHTFRKGGVNAFATENISKFRIFDVPYNREG